MLAKNKRLDFQKHLIFWIGDPCVFWLARMGQQVVKCSGGVGTRGGCKGFEGGGGVNAKLYGIFHVTSLPLKGLPS